MITYGTSKSGAEAGMLLASAEEGRAPGMYNLYSSNSGMYRKVGDAVTFEAAQTDAIAQICVASYVVKSRATADAAAETSAYTSTVLASLFAIDMTSEATVLSSAQALQKLVKALDSTLYDGYSSTVCVGKTFADTSLALTDAMDVFFADVTAETLAFHTNSFEAIKAALGAAQLSAYYTLIELAMLDAATFSFDATARSTFMTYALTVTSKVTVSPPADAVNTFTALYTTTLEAGKLASTYTDATGFFGTGVSEDANSLQVLLATAVCTAYKAVVTDVAASHVTVVIAPTGGC